MPPIVTKNYCLCRVCVADSLDFGERKRVGALVVATVVSENSAKQQAVFWNRCEWKKGARITRYLAHFRKDSNDDQNKCLWQDVATRFFEVGDWWQSGGGNREDGSFPDAVCCWCFCSALVGLMGLLVRGSELEVSARTADSLDLHMCRILISCEGERGNVWHCIGP